MKISSTSSHLILSRLFIVSETSKVKISIGVTLVPTTCKFGSLETLSVIALEELFLSPLLRYVKALLVRRINEQGH